jgi:aspartyl-tRNA(Asn)/glutamyl-tRNA(Gln) amidotransferase subunit A
MPFANAVERLESAIARIERDDLNAWCHLDLEAAREAARASDQRSANAQSLSVIDGCLVGVKANIAVAGWPWAGGLRSRQGVRADSDAAVIEALRAAGAILLGQTTMDAGALGASGRSMQGAIRHPLDGALSVGGSSGGSAAAVAAGHCDAAIGSDTIGSVRIPAALCGIVGFKPSPHRLSLHGVLPVHEDFDHLGPLTREASLARELLRAVGAFTNPVCAPSRSLRCAVMSSFGAVELEATTESAFRAAIGRYADQFASIEQLEWARETGDPLQLRKVRRAIFALCEHRMWLAHREQLERQPEDFDEPLRGMLEFGGQLDAMKLERYRTTVDDFVTRWRELTQNFDIILLPTSPVPAFAHALPTPDSLADLTVIATATGSPAATIPIASEGLPVGLQLVGQPGADELVMALAETLSG